MFIFFIKILFETLGHNFDNPITRSPFTDTEIEYIRS